LQRQPNHVGRLLADGPRDGQDIVDVVQHMPASAHGRAGQGCFEIADAQVVVVF
jgi:hypothetical protein